MRHSSKSANFQAFNPRLSTRDRTTSTPKTNMTLSNCIALALCSYVLIAWTNAQMVTPTIPDPVDLPDDFRCPRKLIFAFECTCHFNREGVLEIPEFREFQCQQRSEAVQNNPGLGVKIARECHRAYGFLPEITAPILRATQDAIFDRCPRVLNKLCPDDPELEILECSCFMFQTGILEGATPEFIQDCIEQWGEVTSANRRIRRRRCKVSIKFKDFDGGLLGLVGRQCFQNNKE